MQELFLKILAVLGLVVLVYVLAVTTQSRIVHNNTIVSETQVGTIERVQLVQGNFSKVSKVVVETDQMTLIVNGTPSIPKNAEAVVVVDKLDRKWFTWKGTKSKYRIR